DYIELYMEQVCGDEQLQVRRVQLTVTFYPGFTPYTPELDTNEAAYFWAATQWVLIAENNESGYSSVPPAPLPFGTAAGAVEVTESTTATVTDWHFPSASTSMNPSASW